MHVMTPRDSWTDERLDDLKGEMNGRFDKLETRFDKLIFVLLTAAVAIIVALIGFSSAILVAVL
jgi:hypothetical protein